MIELAWPAVALIGLAGAYRLASRYLPVANLGPRVAALEKTKDELDAALEFNSGVTQRLAELNDRVGRMELERGLAQ